MVYKRLQIITYPLMNLTKTCFNLIIALCSRMAHSVPLHLQVQYCECLVMLLFHVMYFGIGRFSFCSYATRIFTSALVSKGQISVCNICPILKSALYKYHIIILLLLIMYEIYRISCWSLTVELYGIVSDFMYSIVMRSFISKPTRRWQSLD